MIAIVAGGKDKVTIGRHTKVAGTIGDLMAAGPSTASCYWNRKALTRDRMRGRWFFTGDKYSVDEDGYFWYAGRSDDMFRASGQWLSPIEVESALIEHRCVLEAAVIAFEEGSGLHTPMAFVVLREGYDGTAELVKELQDFVKQRITPYKYPRKRNSSESGATTVSTR